MSTALRSKTTTVSTIDAQLVLKAVGAAITVDTDHATLDRGSDFGSVKLPQVQLFITAIDSVTGDESYIFELRQSSDNFVADNKLVGTYTLAATAAGSLTKELTQVHAFNTNTIDRRYIRLRTDVGGTTPSVTFSAYLTANYG